MIRIREGGLDDPRVIALLAHHLQSARAETAPGSAHALDIDGLRREGIRFWSGWDGERLLSVGALKPLPNAHGPDAHGEVKSMHTAADARRTGAGSAMLRHIIAEARAAGMRRLSLETGSWDYFAPARAFYARHGFVPAAPFGDYRADSNSMFMTLDLQA